LPKIAGGGERAVLVHIDLRGPNGRADRDDSDELQSLALAAGVVPVASIRGARHAPDPKYFAGTGKVDEIRVGVQEQQADVVLFDHELSPSQQRNLEAAIQKPVLDRTGLILDIFAQRARSYEGKLQVELAQLRHLATRLVRGWTHLERQRGGIGLRGPGETQLETDRRLIGERIKQLSRRLARVRAQRAQGRKARRKHELPTVSLAGYTNAGKSTLFNRLTDADVLVADQLFATLDPTLRRIELPGGMPLVIADTVGFIRQLPHELVAAFRSTLEETREASLLLHVIDAGSPHCDQCINEVNEVLKEIGAQAVPQIEVFNKLDTVAGAVPRLDRDESGRPRRVWLSALTGAGVDLLREALAAFFSQDMVREHLRLPPSAGRLRAQLFDMGAVRGERVNDRGEWEIDVEIERSSLKRLHEQEDFAKHLFNARSYAGH